MLPDLRWAPPCHAAALLAAKAVIGPRDCTKGVRVWYRVWCGFRRDLMSNDVSSPILCTCGAVPVIAAAFEHPLEEMRFCPSCRALRCASQCRFQIESKRCAGCERDYSRTPELHCSRNCFMCPQCSSKMEVTAANRSLDGKPGKAFSFRCSACAYAYATGTITRPQPLRAILRGQSDVGSAFRRYQRHWNEDQYGNGPKITQANIANLRLSGLPLPKDSSLATEFVDEAEDKRRAEVLSSTTVGAVPSSDFAKSQPLPRVLDATKSVSCSVCKHLLEMPQGSGFKFQWRAMDFLPRLCPVARPPRKLDGPLYFSIANTLSQSVQLVISTHETVPYRFTAQKTTVSLPFTDIELTGKGKLASIPHATPYPPSSESYQRGDGWCILPIIASVALGVNLLHVKIPVHVSVSTKPPPSVRGAGNADIWQYSSWFLLDFGVVTA